MLETSLDYLLLGYVGELACETGFQELSEAETKLACVFDLLFEGMMQQHKESKAYYVKFIGKQMNKRYLE